MPTTIEVGPVTRIEGHLDIKVTVDLVNGRQQVVEAWSSGTMFRGFEAILKGRHPLDAPHLTQRICGVCPTSHGMASSLVLEAALRLTPPSNGRILRNLVLGADFLQSHLLHFYHLAALDYVNSTGLLDKVPWTPRYVVPDMLTGSTAQALVDHYLQALAIRRKAHQMGAIFGGRMPCSSSLVPGGCVTTVTSAQITQFRSLLSEVTAFINNVYLPDAKLLESKFLGYQNLGRGCGNLLAYGVFDLDTAGSQKLFKRGRYTSTAGSGTYGSVDPARVYEYVKYSNYSSPSALNPSGGQTAPQPGKSGAYSFIKAPRYSEGTAKPLPYEVGPLARMWVNGNYRRGISAMDRVVARALEAQKIAGSMAQWLGQLTPGGATQTRWTVPATGTGVGWTEAPRGRGALAADQQLRDRPLPGGVVDELERFAPRRFWPEGSDRTGPHGNAGRRPEPACRAVARRALLRSLHGLFGAPCPAGREGEQVRRFHLNVPTGQAAPRRGPVFWPRAAGGRSGAKRPKNGPLRGGR